MRRAYSKVFAFVAHEHERRLFEIVQIHVRELPARFLGGLRNAEAVRVPLAPVAVSADVYRAYVRVAVVALGELSDEARMKFYQQRLVEIRRVARHGGERAFRVLPLLLPVVGLVFYALVERPLRRGVGLFAVVVGAGYAERHRQPDLGVIFDELVDFRPVVFAVLGLEVRPVVPAVSYAVGHYPVPPRSLRTRGEPLPGICGRFVAFGKEYGFPLHACAEREREREKCDMQQFHQIFLP